MKRLKWTGVAELRTAVWESVSEACGSRGLQASQVDPARPDLFPVWGQLAARLVGR